MVVSESSARRYALDPDVRLDAGSPRRQRRGLRGIAAALPGPPGAGAGAPGGQPRSGRRPGQDVFLRGVPGAAQLRARRKFATWLFTIANHVAANALATGRGGMKSSPRAAQRLQRHATLDRLVPAASGLMPERQLAKAEARELVRLALESLGERQRMAVLLNKFEAMSYAEIATAMQLSPQAVKSLLVPHGRTCGPCWNPISVPRRRKTKRRETTMTRPKRDIHSLILRRKIAFLSDRPDSSLRSE